MMWWVLLLYFPTFTSSINCGICNGCIPGKFIYNGRCEYCPEGWSQPLSDIHKCEECLAGTFAGARARECTSCPMGWTSFESKAHRCSACKKGTYQSKASSATCINCQVGTFSNQIGSTVCKECPVGFYQDFTGNYPVTSCNECPAGWVQNNKGQGSCEECAPSNCQYCVGYGVVNEECQRCPIGQYSNQTAVCSQCPQGFEGGYKRRDFEVQITSNGANTCVQCEQGFEYLNGTCTECSVGTYSDNYTCINCPSGYFRDTAVDKTELCFCDLCKTCPSGFFGGNGVNCEACAAGKYQDTPGQPTCIDCEFPTKSGPASKICTEHCLSGFEDDTQQCKVCPAGKNGLSATTCQLCPEGRVKREDYGECIMCPEGHTHTSERTGCQTCEAGKFASTLGICTKCEQGYYMKQYNFSIPPLKCEATAPGSYQNEIGQENYKKCQPGTFTNRYNSSVCESCAIGRFSQEEFSNCELCPTGYGADSEGSESCVVCSSEQMTIDGSCQFCPKGTEVLSTFCVDCPQGKINNVSNGDRCFSCPKDFYSNDTSTCARCIQDSVTNLMGPGSWKCQSSSVGRKCSAGDFSDDSTCTGCPTGYISAAEATECVECTTTQIEVNHKVCEECSTGMFQNNNTCTVCSTGKYGTIGGCLDCAMGQYQDEEAKDDCQLCPRLKVTVGKGSTSEENCTKCSDESVYVIDGICATCAPGKKEVDDGCQNCAGGRYRTATDNDCELCPIGKTASSGNPCQNCAAGTYQNEEGQTECKDCLAGVTATGCLVCPSGTYGSNCDICPQGFWSLAGQESCSMCSIGLYQNEQGSDSCITCAAGKYQEELGQPLCKLCAVGQFQPSERAGICIGCLQGLYMDEEAGTVCKECPAGKFTESEESKELNDCLPCPAGTMEVNGVCIYCPERFYGDEEAATACKSCPGNQLSPKNSTNVDACFSKEGLVTFVFGMKGDSKVAQSHTKNCEIRPNLVMLCPGCSCDDDSRNGFWDGPVCNECRRGFATRDCTAICPAYDGSHDSTMCNGNGFCWYGKFGDGLCYCGGKSDIDSTGENVVVDIRLCPKGKICPGYGEKEQTETNYLPRYYIMQYRQYSVFVLMMSRYTPQRGHMWFKRFPPSIAYENTCLVCTGGYRKTPKTMVGFWNKDQEYEFFGDDLQTLNGFHGENCQYECALCLNGGICQNVPHPYRLSYTIEDTFRPQREIFIPQTNCICSTMVFDPENMCCPNGFQPFVHYGLRLNPDPYTRFNRLPYLTSIKNEKQDYWINRDIYLEPDLKYVTPFAEPDNGLMWVANNNKLYSDKHEDYVQMPYKNVGPYNKHVFYGVPREICRACPGLFGKGVRSAATIIDTEEKAEEIWWDNAMGASARKCNGIGVCDFYNRPEETTVKFMGDASQFQLYERGKLCNALPIAGQQNKKTLQECIKFGQEANINAEFIAFTEPYKGGQFTDMNGKYYINELVADTNARAQYSVGYASYLNGTQLQWTILAPSDSSKMPIPDSDSPFTIYSVSTSRCAAYSTCDTFINVPRFNIYKLKLGDGDDRLTKATFNRFDTCFTYTKDNIKRFDLYLTQEYTQGLDPFLGGLCPKGHYCTEFEGVGYKEACPAGYYQPYQGVSRSLDSSQCNTATVYLNGCQENLATVAVNDFTDNVCVRCPRNFFAAKGAPICTECPHGTIKKISGEFTKNTQMLNMPIFFITGYNPWYYIPNEQGYQSADCALMPPGIIHIPEANNHMSYDRKNFLAVMACPFGLSSRPGTFSIEQHENLLTLLLSREESVIQAPYIRFDQTYTIEEVPGSTCGCSGYSSISKRDCKQYLEEELGITTMLDRAGPKGCFRHAAHPDIGFFSDGSTEILLQALTYICRSGVDNDQLAGQFARANCFRCPGNSMTGPSSTTCTTCFANQMKVYAKEAIQKFAENTLPSLKPSTVGSQDQLMKFSAKLPNYDLVYTATEQNYNPTYIFDPRRSTDTTELSLADCYLACSSLESPLLLAIGILENGLSKCACSTERGGSNTDYVYWEVKGTIDKGGCAGAAFVQFGEHSPAVELDWKHSGILTDCSQFINDLGPYKGSNNGGWLVSPCEGGRMLNDCTDYSYNGWAVEACKWGRKLHNMVGTGNQVLIVGSSPQVPIGCSVETNIAKSFVNMPHWNTGGTYYISDTPCEYPIQSAIECMEAFDYLNGDTEDIIECENACGLPAAHFPPACYIRSGGKWFYNHNHDSTDCQDGCVCVESLTEDINNFKVVDSYPSWGGEALPLCAACQPGKKTEGSCKSCDKGMYTETPAQADKSVCEKCVSGRYAPRIGSTGCLECPEGFFQDERQKPSCIACPEGFYQNMVGSLTCKGCPLGYSASVESSLLCAPCTAGEFAETVEAKICEKCSIGMYAHVLGSRICKNCPKGYYGKSVKAQSCEECQPGKFQPAEKSVLCKECQPGTYSLGTVIDMAISCSNCPTGYYQQNTGGKNCERCRGGKACTQTSAGVPCLSDKYQTVETWDVCKPCGAEEEVITGNTGCDECETGKTTSGESGTTCKDCPDEGWTPVLWVDWGEPGYLSSCSQFYNQIGPYAGNGGGGGLQMACEAGRRGDGCSAYSLSYERTACGYGRKLNEKGLKGMTTHYSTIGVSNLQPYHRCLFGGSLPLCNAFGGLRMVQTYITARKTTDYTFSTTIWDEGSVEFVFFGGREKILENLWRNSQTTTIRLERGERLAITLQYYRFVTPGIFGTFFLPYIGVMNMEPSNLLITHRANPGSDYCGLNA